MWTCLVVVAELTTKDLDLPPPSLAVFEAYSVGEEESPLNVRFQFVSSSGRRHAHVFEAYRHRNGADVAQ